MRLDDSRRLFGPNLDCPGPAAIAEVFFDPGEDAESALVRWRFLVSSIVDAGRLHVRRFHGGAALVIEGQLDELLALTDVNDAAIAGTVDATALRKAVAAAADPALRRLLAAARARGVPALVDDESVSLGLGKRAVVLPRGGLPGPDSVDWDAVGRIPVVLVTGTNGKTTTVRLIGRIAAEAGHHVGLATTDGIHAGGVLLASGDYTGPDAARTILRHPDVDLAVLETARGGILRRGLAIDRADVAVLTNVSADHLGRYGIDDVETMGRVKRVVGSVADRVVTNADDPRTSGPFAGRATTFGIAHGADWTLVDGALARRGERLLPVADIPITFGGQAVHNVANALAAAAAAEALGLPWEAVRRGLTGFVAADNPGRANLIEVGATRVLLDFGHNPEGVKAILGLTGALGGGRLIVVLALPGDRDDAAIRSVAQSVAGARPARVYLHDMPDYLRGRQPGEVPALIAAELERSGLDRSAIERTEGEVAGLTRALDGAVPGDLVVVFPHLERDAAAALLRTRQGTSS